MSLSSAAFLVEEAGKNIRRNGLMSLAALTTVTIAMAVLGGALFALYRLHQFAASQSEGFDVMVFARKELGREKTLDLRKRIAALPGVGWARIVTSEEAWAEMQREDRANRTHITSALDGENPLPDRVDVRPSDPRQTGAIVAALQDPAQFPEVDSVRNDRQGLDQVLAAERLVRNVGGALAVLLFIATAFVIQNTIRLTVYARRREMRIMQLVGATAGFIRLPLVLEGIFYGVVGSAAASGLVLFVVRQVSVYVGRFETPLAQNMPAAVGPGVVIGMLVALGALVGWATSIVSIHRFLRKA